MPNPGVEARPQASCLTRAGVIRIRTSDTEVWTASSSQGQRGTHFAGSHTILRCLPSLAHHTQLLAVCTKPSPNSLMTVTICHSSGVCLEAAGWLSRGVSQVVAVRWLGGVKFSHFHVTTDTHPRPEPCQKLSWNERSGTPLSPEV